MIAIAKLQHICSLFQAQRACFALLRFHLPDLGEKIKQGKVRKLYVKEGDSISEFDKMADVESDKQFTEITSPDSGIIKKLYYHEDQVCRVGDVFLEIQTNSDKKVSEEKVVEKVVEQKEKKEEKVEEVHVSQSHHTHSHGHGESEVLASSTVKMWAREHKVDLSHVRGSGRKGRILKEDIIYFVEDRTKAKQGKIAPTPKQQKAHVKPSLSITTVKMNNQEKKLYKMVNYSNGIPHLYYQQTFDVTQIQQIISKLKQKQPKVSLLSILIKTFSLAIKEYPRMNSTYNVADPFNYKTHSHHNIIIPSFTDKGVVFNSVNSAQGLNIRQIQSTINSFDSQSFGLESLKQGTISISNIGSLGTHAMNPIIYGELACHASIGSLRTEPVYHSGKVIQRQVVDVTMGCDHRVLDGATVARFTSLWRDYTAKPTLAFLSMI